MSEPAHEHVPPGPSGAGPSHEAPAAPSVTLLLHAAASGNQRDLDALMAAIYEDMRRLAVSHMRGERRNHTLQPTALVHEAYVRLLGQHATAWKDRLHFFAIASRIIRRILIDHARAAQAEKRGGDRTRISIDGHDAAAPLAGSRAGRSGPSEIDLLALDEALQELAKLDEQQARIVELRYFGGCTVDEVAELLNVGKRTVDRHWQAARAWLFDRLRDDEPEGARPGAE